MPKLPYISPTVVVADFATTTAILRSSGPAPTQTIIFGVRIDNTPQTEIEL